MKKIAGIVVLCALALAGCPNDEQDITLTIGQKAQLAAPNGTVIWVSDDVRTATVSESGIVKAVGVADGSSAFTSGPATGTVTITATASGASKKFTVNTTTAAQEDIMTVPALKELFKDHFLIGNIFNPGDAPNASGINNERLVRHYNVLTAENNMKPGYLSAGNAGQLNMANFTTAVRMIDAAIASGMKVVGHTLLWHSQIPDWQKNLNESTGKETALEYMRTFIAAVVGHPDIKGKIYSWDVLNEAFPDSGYADWRTFIRKENPWYASIGSDFVYEGFLAARQADPNAILYYNDYNLNNANKARLVRDMVRDVNEQYKAAFPSETRLLIEGIGMQSHHNTDVTAAQIKASLDLFRPLGVKIAISEFDILGQGWSQFSPVGSGTNRQNNSTITNNGIITQARLFNEFMTLFVQNDDIIERVSMWGLTDNASWRSAGLPTLFDSSGKAKPAYYGFVNALDNEQ